MPGRQPGHQARKPMTPTHNLRLAVAFDGSAYCGWQIQKDLPTVQGMLQDAIQRITGERVCLVGSGRTDAGTHARALVANFHTGTRIPPGHLVRALNSALPADIRVLSARRAAAGFHAQRSARSKIYGYQIFRGPVLPPHLRHEYFHYPFEIDPAAMERAARLFVGRHDFASFAATVRKGLRGVAGAAKDRNTVRTIYACRLRRTGNRLMFSVEGDGFLHHMVRNIVGTLLEVGRGQMTLREFRDLFKRRDRRLAGFTAPAHGLVLVRVRY